MTGELRPPHCDRAIRETVEGAAQLHSAPAESYGPPGSTEHQQDPQRADWTVFAQYRTAEEGMQSSRPA
jgi:hypothetical protein